MRTVIKITLTIIVVFLYLAILGVVEYNVYNGNSPHTVNGFIFSISALVIYGIWKYSPENDDEHKLDKS